MSSNANENTLNLSGPGNGSGPGHIRCLSVVPVDLEALLNEMENASQADAE